MLLADPRMCDRVAIAHCLWLAACAYHGGSFATYDHAFLGARATFGCVDASVARRRDIADRPVIAYEFGNRCDGPVVIDLARVEAYGRDTNGDKVALRAYDPDRELAAGLLDGRSSGDETISYAADGDPTLDSICVDPSAAFGGAEPRWSCFASVP